MDEVKMVSGFLMSIYALAVYKVYLDTFLKKTGTVPCVFRMVSIFFMAVFY